MEIPLASQDIGVRFWSIASATMLGILTIVAGVMLMFAEKHTAAFHAEHSAGFQLVSTLGLGAIIITWCGYLAMLVILLGYARNATRNWITVLIFLVSAVYMLFVMVVSISPLTCMCTTVM